MSGYRKTVCPVTLSGRLARLSYLGGAVGTILLLGLSNAHAQFVQALPQPSIYCEDYDVRNNTNLHVSIQFDALPNERYELEPGQSVNYHKTQYCAAPAYVVAGHSGPRSGTIGRNLALDPRSPHYEIVEAGRYVFLNRVGDAIPPEFR
jgi:hypothetical protein